MAKTSEGTFRIPGGFYIENPFPADDRLLVNLDADLLSNTALPFIYEGIIVYSNESKDHYGWNGVDRTKAENWIPFAKNTSVLNVTSATNFNTSTLFGGVSQFGKMVIVDNGDNDITITIDSPCNTTYKKADGASGVITFVSGTGRTLLPTNFIQENTLIASTDVAYILSEGTNDNLFINVVDISTNATKEYLAQNGSLDLDIRTFGEAYIELDGDLDLDILAASVPIGNKSNPKNITIETNTHNISIPEAWNTTGEYDATLDFNYLSISVARFPTKGVIITCFINPI